MTGVRPDARRSVRADGPNAAGTPARWTGSFRRWFASRVSAWMFVPVVPVEIFGYFDRGRPWRGDWLWTMDWVGTMLFIPGLLVAMGCAIDTGRAAGRHRDWLMSTSPARWKAPASLALPGLVTVGLVHLLAVAAHLATTAAVATAPPPAAVPVMLLVQLAGVAFFVMLGMVAGWLLGPVLGPIGAATVVLITTYGGDHESFDPLGFGSATVSLVGWELSYDHAALQLAVLSALIALGALVRTRFTAAGTRVPTVGGAVALALAVAVLVGPRSFGPDQRFVPGDLPGMGDCVGERVPVCFHPEHRPFAEAVVGDVEAFYRLAAERGVADLLPARVVEDVHGRLAARDAATLTPTPDELASGEISPVRLAQEILMPHHCAQLYADSPPAAEYWLSMEALMIYLTSLQAYVVEAGFPDVATYRAQAEQTGGGLAVAGTPPRELTRPAARSALERLRACAF
ncbi:MAG: hypothetical protein ACRDOO_06515 [Actinomadura sp.]